MIFNNIADNLNRYNVSYSCFYIFNRDDISVSCNDDFSILHIYPRSFNKNCDQINAFLSGLKQIFSVITMSETWFKVDDTPNGRSPRKN